MSSSEVLEQLTAVIESRQRERPAGSYVTSLFAGGHAAIADKVREEAEELIEASAGSDASHTAHEAADLIFHTLVLLAQAGVAPRDVFGELERRFGTGGLEEKRARARGDA